MLVDLDSRSFLGKRGALVGDRPSMTNDDAERLEKTTNMVTHVAHKNGVRLVSIWIFF